MIKEFVVDVVNSGIAVQECIRALSKTPTQFLKAGATLIPDSPLYPRSQVFITFDRTNVSDFPIVTCDAEVMKGFGVPHGSFNPNFVMFSFNKERMELRVADMDYGFALSGITLRAH